MTVPAIYHATLHLHLTTPAPHPQPNYVMAHATQSIHTILAEIFRPSTQGEKDIEVARAITRAHYHPPPPSFQKQFEKWYDTSITNSTFNPRVKDLYYDRQQTNSQQAIFLDLKWTHTVRDMYDEDGMWIDQEASAEQDLYDCVLDQHRERQACMQAQAVERLSIWSVWDAEKLRQVESRDNGLLTACESTLGFLEDDYVKRKIGFVVAVSTLLERGEDIERARMVVDDLGSLFPRLKGLCRKLIRHDVSSDGFSVS
jgi:hypothetical protein